MDIEALILKELKKRGEIRTAEIVRATGFSRVYINRFLNILESKGKIILIGKANQARYIRATSARAKLAKATNLHTHKIIENRAISEDLVLDEIKKTTGIFLAVPLNVSRIVEYAFTEILNNAIEHSRSKKIEIEMLRGRKAIEFVISDTGIGIFNNIMKTRGLQNEMEAIQDLLKGKQTTAPETHSGEGIFFTSKAGDFLEIKSGEKKLIFENLIHDIFIRDGKNAKGTKVIFRIRLRAPQRLDVIFKEYAGAAFEFGKTRVVVNLYKADNTYISRSQARRILFGLEKFKEITLDFKNVETAGQAFADEVFRVWKIRHPHIRIVTRNANENVEFMIRRSVGEN